MSKYVEVGAHGRSECQSAASYVARSCLLSSGAGELEVTFPNPCAGPLQKDSSLGALLAAPYLNLFEGSPEP